MHKIDQEKLLKKEKKRDIIQGMKKDAGCQLFMEVMQRKTAYQDVPRS